MYKHIIRNVHMVVGDNWYPEKKPDDITTVILVALQQGFQGSIRILEPLASTIIHPRGHLYGRGLWFSSVCLFVSIVTVIKAVLRTLANELRQFVERNGLADKAIPGSVVMRLAKLRTREGSSQALRTWACTLATPPAAWQPPASPRFIWGTMDHKKADTSR